MKMTKVFAVAITAVFCITAFGAIFSDDAYAADNIRHNIYLEVIGDDGLSVEAFWFYFDSENTVESFIAEANKMALLEGYDLQLSYNAEYESIGIGYGGGNAATYIVKDGQWAAANKTAEEYPVAESLYFVIGHGYISTAVYDTLTDAEKAKWSETGMGYGYDYMRKAQVGVSDLPEKKDYHVFVEIISAEGKVTSSKWVNFEGFKTERGFVCAANIAFAANDLGKLAVSQKAGGAGSISIKYDGSGNNCTACVVDGKWTHVTKTGEQYVASEALAFSVAHGYIGIPVYNALSDDDKKNWEDSGMTYEGYEYQKVVTEDVDGYKEKKNNNIALYVGIGVAAVVVIGAVAFFLLRKH